MPNLIPTNGSNHLSAVAEIYPDKLRVDSIAKLVRNVPLPLAGEVQALAALHRQSGYAAHLIAIRDRLVVAD